MTFVATFIVLAIAGIFNTGYLVSQHLKTKPLVCPLDHDCSVVTESRWSKIFGVRNDYLGFVFYSLLFLGILGKIILPSYAQSLATLLVLGTGAGLIFSIFLVFLQIFVIKDYCFYCMISALLALLLFINSLALAYA